MKIKKVLFVTVSISLLLINIGCSKEKSKIAQQDVISTETSAQNELTESIEEDLSAPIENKDEIIVDDFTVFDEAKIMYVYTDDGSNLNYRKEPVDGEKPGKFSQGTCLRILKRTNNKYRIDDIEDYWYYALSDADITPYGGWVFGGFLTEDATKPVKNLLLGKWDTDYYILTIDIDGTIILGRKESEGICGNWKLIDGKTLDFYNARVYDEDPEEYIWKINYVNNYSLSITWNDNTTVYTRIN